MPASRNGFKKRCPSCKKAYRRERDNARNRRVRKARRLLDPEWAAKDRARVLERWRAKYDRLRASVREKSGGVCYLCAEPIDFSGPWHVDHVLARVRGGSDDLSNLKATHVDCNLSKGDMLVEDYLRRAALSLTG